MEFLKIFTGKNLKPQDVGLQQSQKKLEMF